MATRADVALGVAWSYHGTPYIWGGDDPAGFDCSGLIIECLKSVGVLPRKGDWTADGLYNLFTHIPEEQIKAGDLIFWEGENKKMIHVEMVLASDLSIGASGGGSWATDPKLAIEKGAYVKIRPFATRGGAYHFARPY